jgi:hypothetical protein
LINSSADGKKWQVNFRQVRKKGAARCCPKNGFRERMLLMAQQIFQPDRDGLVERPEAAGSCSAEYEHRTNPRLSPFSRSRSGACTRSCEYSQQLQVTVKPAGHASGRMTKNVRAMTL